MEAEERDITIGPGKLLGLFFMLVAICGVFFAIGYSLGKTSAREQALNDKAPLSASLNAPAMPGDSSAPKPSAIVVTKPDTDGNSAQKQEETPSAPDLTFFNAVKRDDHSGKPAAESASGKPASTVSVASNGVAPAVTAASQPAEKSQPTTSVTTTASGAFVVQIAAVTREEDAAALAGALRKKSYSVFVVNNPAVHDKFYHVQVGPFSTLQDAEAMKAKLTSEGYNPIVKKSA